MVLIPAIGQRIQDGGVNDDHELSRLRAEALSKQLIGSLGHRWALFQPVTPGSVLR